MLVARRFVCRKRLGGRKGEPAAYLTPVPPNAVVYGSGETARVITKVCAVAEAALKQQVQQRESCSWVNAACIPAVLW
jgi:hypothetical protein